MILSVPPPPLLSPPGSLKPVRAAHGLPVLQPAPWVLSGQTAGAPTLPLLPTLEQTGQAIQTLFQQAEGQVTTAVLNTFPWLVTLFDSGWGRPNLGDNLQVVGPGMIRGAYPSESTLDKLAQQDIKAVIDLRRLTPRRQTEARARVEDRGMAYHNIPLMPQRGPSTEQTRQLLSLFEQYPKVFIHCTQGKDRTGAVAALYESTILHQPLATIESRMQARGFRPSQFPQLQQWVEQLATSPAMVSQTA